MYSKLKKWGVLACLSAGLTLGAWGQAQAAYPEKPVRVIVNYAAGGYLDVIARLVLEHVSKQINQPVVIENKPGAAGNIGAHYVARQKPDGYQLLLTVDGLYTINPEIFSQLNYDPKTDLLPITRFGSFNQVLLVNKSSGITDLASFIDKAKNQEMFYTSAGVGTPGHLAMEMFNQESGLNVEHVPYLGNAPATQALLRGDVDVGFLVVGTTIQYVNSGDFVPLAVSGKERDARMSEIPTVQEAQIDSLSDFEVQFGHVLMAPAGTDPEILEFWSQEVQKAFADPEIRAQLDAFNLNPSVSSPNETADFLQKEAERWKPVLKNTEISIN